MKTEKYISNFYNVIVTILKILTYTDSTVMWIKCAHITTVKHGSSEHAYNELTLKAKGFSFPVTLSHVVNLTDVTNCAYIKVKSPIPGTPS